MFSVILFSNQLAKASNLPIYNGMNRVDSLKADSLVVRLNQIRSYNKLNLTTVNRRILRKEVQTIKKQLKVIHRGIYLSVGTIIVIVLLLIILF